MIQISHFFQLDENEFSWSFVRSSGPGGQNVNKVATAVQLCLDVRHSSSIPEEIRDRLLLRLGHRINKEGELQIYARRYRSQLQNRQDALKRLTRLLEDACVEPKKRKRSHISSSVKQKRLDLKQRQSEKKQRRQSFRFSYD